MTPIHEIEKKCLCPGFIPDGKSGFVKNTNDEHVANCPCHSVAVDRCSCLEDNKLSQALCKVHSKNNSDRVDITWKERFDEKFPHILSTGTGLASEELKSFIASEREILLKELIDEIEKIKIYPPFVFDRKNLSGEKERGYNQAITEVKELIRKKM